MEGKSGGRERESDENQPRRGFGEEKPGDGREGGSDSDPHLGSEVAHSRIRRLDRWVLEQVLEVDRILGEGT